MCAPFLKPHQVAWTPGRCTPTARPWWRRRRANIVSVSKGNRRASNPSAPNPNWKDALRASAIWPAVRLITIAVGNRSLPKLHTSCIDIQPRINDDKLVAGRQSEMFSPVRIFLLSCGVRATDEECRHYLTAQPSAQHRLNSKQKNKK
jgi:hypothetical protein